MFWKTTLLFVILFSFHFELWSQDNFFQKSLSEYEYFHKKQQDTNALFIAKKLLHWCESNEKDTSLRLSMAYKTIAIAYSAVEENDSAGFYFRKSIEIFKYQKLENTDDYRKLLNSYAGFNKKIGNFANAELYYSNALKLSSDTSKIDQTEFARLLNNYADYFLTIGDANKADSLVQEALTLYKKVYSGDKSKYIFCLHTRAMTLFSTGKLPEAQKQFQEWISIIDTMADKKNSKINGLLDYSELLIKLEKYQDARNKLNQADAPINKKEFDVKDKLKAKYFKVIGLLEFKQNIDSDSKTCLSHYFKAQKILAKDTSNYFGELSDIWEGIADIYIKLEKYDSAFFYSEKALKSRKYHFRELHPDYASSLNQISKVYKARGEYEEALEIRLKALEIRRIVLSIRHPDYAASLNNLGNLYKVLGDFKNAEKYYLEALEIRKIVYKEKHSQYAASLHNLGELYFDEGDYKSSSTYFEKCIEIKKSLKTEGNVDLANSLKEYARLHIEIGNYKEAENMLKEVLAIYSKTQDKNETSAFANTLNYLGIVYYKMKEYQKAEAEYKKALEIIAKNNTINSSKKLYANLMYYQGRNFLKLEKSPFKNAEKCFRECLSIRRQLFKGNDNHPEIAKAFKNFGDLFLAINEYDSSLYYYDKSYKINKKIFGDNHKETVKRQFEIAKLYDAWGKKQQAFNLYCTLFTLKSNEISNNFEWLSDEQKELYWNLENEYYNELFQFGNENYKTIPEVSSLNYNAALITKGKLLENKISSENYYREIDDIREELSMKRRMLAKIDSDGSIENDTALIIKHDKLNKEIDSLDIQLRNAWPEYQQQKENLEITWEKIQANLELGEVAIEFIRIKNKHDTNYYYNAIILKSGGKFPSIIQLCNENDLQKIQPQSGFSQYYNLIWKPMETELSNIHTIYYSPTGELNKVPFQAIYAPVSGGDKIISSSSDNRGIGEEYVDVETEENSHFLIDTYSLHQLTSTRYLAMGIKENANESIDPSIALIGGIDYDYLPKPDYKKIEVENTNQNAKRSSALTGSKLDYLAGTKNEITAISNLLTPLSWKTEVFAGSEAKEENIMRLEGKYSKSILHIATHGYAFQDERFNESSSNTNSLNYNYRFSKNPMVRSGLILAGGNWAWTGSDTLSKLGAEQNGILTALEVSQLNLKKTKLVVLSACETGLGKIEGSEGTFGLKRGFKLAGVEQMIVSLWSVPDKETMELMTLFYSDLTKTLNPVISFEKAQKEMRRLYPTDPNKWAGFVLVR